MIAGALARYWPAAVGTLLLAALAGMYLLWQGAERRAAALAVDLRGAKAEILAADRRSDSLERAAAERAVDTQDRTTETDRVGDALDRIEQKVERHEPVEADAAARAVTCSRLRRQGQTASAQYRASCG